MRKFFARAATLTREIAEWLIPVFTAINLLIEIVGKVANCPGHHDAYQLRVQI
jgi:hypothetical protein